MKLSEPVLKSRTCFQRKKVNKTVNYVVKFTNWLDANKTRSGWSTDFRSVDL